MLLLLLTACTPKDLPPPPEPVSSDQETGAADGGTTDGTTDGGADGGSTDGGTTDGGSTDGGTTDAPLELSGGCEAPGALPQDPLVIERSYGEASTREIEFELTQVVASSDGATIYAVGQHGLQIFQPDGDTFSKRGSYSGQRNYWYQVALIDDEYAAVSHWEQGVDVVDLRNPDSPQQAASMGIPGASGLSVDGDDLYVLSYEGSVDRYDVTEPTAPAWRARYEGLSSPWTMALTDELAYVADNDLGLVVLRRDGADLSLIGAADERAGALDLAVEDQWLYVAAGNSGVRVYSLADPEAPEWVAELPLGYNVLSVSVDPDARVVYAANQDAVLAVDVTDPTAPQARAAQSTEEWALGVLAVEGGVMLAAWQELIQYAYDPSILAPELALEVRSVLVPTDGGDKTITLHNRGGAELVISGGEVTAPHYSASVQAASVPPGGSTELTVSFDGEGVGEGELCLATNDPDEPVLTLPIEFTESAGRFEGLGEPVPDFTLTDLDGVTWRLSEHIGTPIFISFFATW